ncbi:MAG: type II toxin-antitoxin system VapC family toxin [Deltaproteobacteria bacterium]|nr:type II toxin-antitoxin system VapC family toxin [Deltaproteobacteria bacterium]
MEDRFVVDNSVVMGWCFEDESSEYADAVLDRLTKSEAIVPGIWPLEVVNVLLLAERRGRISRSGAMRFIELLRSLPIVVEQEPPGRVFSEIRSLAREAEITAYDASYLDLALRDGLPVASLDKAMRRAASRLQIPVLGEVG